MLRAMPNASVAGLKQMGDGGLRALSGAVAREVAERAAKGALKLSEATPIMPPKKRESLTAAQHLAKYGANEAFYTEYDEGARIVCATLPYCRLRADNRRKVLEYLVCVSDKSAERHCFRTRYSEPTRWKTGRHPSRSASLRVFTWTSPSRAACSRNPRRPTSTRS